MSVSGFTCRPPRGQLPSAFILGKLQDIDVHLKKLTQIVIRLDEKVSHLDGRMSNVEDRLTKVEGRLTNVEHRLTDLDGRMTRVERHLTDLDTRVSKLEVSFRWATAATFTGVALVSLGTTVYKLLEHHILIGWQ